MIKKLNKIKMYGSFSIEKIDKNFNKEKLVYFNVLG
jgi:hypothetical protein